jgi:hypothetical protein
VTFGRQQAHQCAHQRRFARTVGAKHRNEFTLVDVQIDWPKGLDVPVARRQPLDFEDTICWRRTAHFTILT